jgi:hypothetical protein
LKIRFATHEKQIRSHAVIRSVGDDGPKQNLHDERFAIGAIRLRKATFYLGQPGFSETLPSTGSTRLDCKSYILGHAKGYE